MGLSISLLSLTWIEVTRKNIVGLETITLFKSSGINPENAASNDSSKEIQKIALGCKSLEIEKNPKLEDENPMTELHEAAVKLQKVYKSYRTRRNLADCAVVVEELWWKALDFASLRRSSISFFDDEKPETAISRWARARTMAAKVGKGLSKSDKAKKLALQHWLEAIDPRHRYGHNLHFYYDVWFKSESAQPFFYWLDIGDGREVNLHKIPRSILQSQCITYLGPNERNAYEVIVEDGKLVYKQSGIFVDTADGSKWIFVLSTMRALYVGKKKKGKFQHSSFLAGGAITAAGRLIVEDGILQVIWPYSGHYHPTEENFQEFIHYLEDNGVELTDVKRCALDDDSYSSCMNLNYMTSKTEEKETSAEEDNAAMSGAEEEEPHKDQHEARFNSKTNTFKSLSVKLSRERMTCNWTTGAGPRIGCVRDYPSNLQSKALEHVNLSPRFVTSINVNKGPIPSPRPSPGVMLSPRLASMGMPSPSNKSSTYQIHEELRSLQSLRNKRL